MTSFFCWHELRTPNRDASKRFYSEVLGWKLEDHPMGPGQVYTGIMIGERGVGGFTDLPPGAPPHWISYVTVDNVDAAVERATRGKGKCIVPGTDIPQVGRFAVLQDPQGAHVCVWKGQHPEKPDEPFAPGAYCWNELVTTDVAGAKRFYGELFNWTFADMPMGEMGTYTMVKSDGKDVGGIMQIPPQAKGPPAWIGYVFVKDVDATAAKVTANGGKLHHPPSDIPNIGRFSVCADPAGAVFAIYKSKTA